RSSDLPAVMTIDDMQQQRGWPGLFRSCPECLDQFVRQMADETYRVGHYDRSDVRKLQPAQCRVQGCKQLVSSIYAGCGNSVEQGRLARIGVTHQRQDRKSVV